MTRWMGKKLGLALGGGGVRGFCHVGVLKVLEQEGIAVDMIAGTSAGALIGAAYASGSPLEEIHRKIDAYILSPQFLSSTLRDVGLAMNSVEQTFWEKTRNAILQKYFLLSTFVKPAILPRQDFETLVGYFIPDIDVRETKIPFYAVATDLITGKQIIVSEGSLRQAVWASSAVPGAVDPVRLGNWLLADGGITSPVPVRAVRQAGADSVIAVVVDREKNVLEEFETAQEIVYRAGDITSDKLQEAELLLADVVIRPRIGNLHWTDFSRAKGLIQEGETAARQSLGAIREAIPVYKKIMLMARKLTPAKPQETQTAKRQQGRP